VSELQRAVLGARLRRMDTNLAEHGNNLQLAETEKPKFVATNPWGLTDRQDAWISYCAVGGLITDDDGRVRKMTLEEFCATFDVPERTLYNWKKSIPDFAGKVRQRRMDLYSMSRETNMWNRLYLIAMTSKDHKAAVQAITSLQGHFAKLELPSQRHEVEHQLGNTWTDLLQQKMPVIEAEIVNESTTDQPA